MVYNSNARYAACSACIKIKHDHSNRSSNNAVIIKCKILRIDRPDFFVLFFLCVCVFVSSSSIEQILTVTIVLQTLPVRSPKKKP